jgi:hypothetical protein
MTPTTIPVEVRLAYRDNGADSYVAVAFSSWLLCEWRPGTGFTLPVSVLAPMWIDLAPCEVERVTELAWGVWREGRRAQTQHQEATPCE